MTIDDWKRAAYALLALPAFFGGRRARRVLARRLLGAELMPGGFLPALATFPLGVLIWYLVGRIATYGFFWDDATAAGSWGGPSLTGAWIVHFLCALGMVTVCLWPLRPLVRAQIHDSANSSHAR